MKYEVIVGNVGTIYQGDNLASARKEYKAYVKISKEGYGRAGNEEVTLFDGGDILEEYHPKEQKFVYPTIAELYPCIRACKPTKQECEEYSDGYSDGYIDVRIQCETDGWQFHSGDPQYDTSYKGVWGYGTLAWNDNCREKARELIDAAKDDAAERGQYC